MAIGTSERHGHRDAVTIGQQVMFRAIFPSIRGIRPRLRPAKTARTEVLPTTARDQFSAKKRYGFAESSGRGVWKLSIAGGNLVTRKMKGSNAA